MRQKQERLEQMRQQLVQERLQERVLVQELVLLFYRKRQVRQQPKWSPTGAILSCQFSLYGIKQFLEIVTVYTMTELLESPPLTQPNIIG
jgi:hypothetical protein